MATKKPAAKKIAIKPIKIDKSVAAYIPILVKDIYGYRGVTIPGEYTWKFGVISQLKTDLYTHAVALTGFIHPIDTFEEHAVRIGLKKR